MKAALLIACLLLVGCLSPDATPEERARYAGTMEALATSSEMTGQAAALLTGGISLPVMGAVAAVFRALGKRAGVRAVVDPIEINRLKDEENRIGKRLSSDTSSVKVVVFVADHPEKVAKMIKRATARKR